jgi:hypothetical protein
MIFYEHNWERLKVEEPGAVYSLTFLRGLRDKLAAYLVEEAEYYVGEEPEDDDTGPKDWADQIVTYQYAQNGYEKLRDVFTSRDRFETAKQVRLLRTICRRIARLEREGCHIPIKGDLVDA